MFKDTTSKTFSRMSQFLVFNSLVFLMHCTKYFRINLERRDTEMFRTVGLRVEEVTVKDEVEELTVVPSTEHWISKKNVFCWYQ